MSCFLVVSAPADRQDATADTFDRGLWSARDLLDTQPQQVFRGEGMLAATFCRVDGSGGEMAIEAHGAGCLLSSGTWFHRGGASNADQLLARLREIGHPSLMSELDGTFVVVDLDVRECQVTAFTDILGTGRCYVRELDNGTVALSGSRCSSPRWHRPSSILWAPRSSSTSAMSTRNGPSFGRSKSSARRAPW